MGNKSLAPRKAELFVLQGFLKTRQGASKIVIHIVEESVHILLINSGKIPLDKRGECPYTRSQRPGASVFGR